MAKGTNNLKGAGPGRPKGSKDKITKNLKQMVLDAAEQLEKDGKGLQVEADKDPKWFFANFLKPMLPKDIIVQGDENNPLITKIEFTLVRPKDS